MEEMIKHWKNLNYFLARFDDDIDVIWSYSKLPLKKFIWLIFCLVYFFISMSLISTLCALPLSIYILEYWLFFFFKVFVCVIKLLVGDSQVLNVGI